MEYLSIGKSGLISILIPLNFLIGEYTYASRLLGFNRKKIHCLVSIVIIALVGILIMTGADPYYPFIIFGGTIIGIVQSEWSYRKVEQLNSLVGVEVFLKKMRVFGGFFVLFLVVVLRQLYPAIFLELPKIERLFSYCILFVLASELIFLNTFILCTNKQKQKG